MDGYRTITKKDFVEDASIAYDLLKRSPKMAIHLELSHFGKNLRASYWIYSSKPLGSVRTIPRKLRTAFIKTKTGQK